jgi:hypothetical protein
MTTYYNKPGVPHKNWQLENYEDSGELNYHCDMCGTPIRHLYTMSHYDFPKLLTVGSTCTENIGMKSEIAKFQYYSNRWQRIHLGEERMYKGKHLKIVLAGKDYYIFTINSKRHPFWHAKTMIAAKLKLYKELQK